jgi:excisionase family DNA binding protein
MNTDHPIEFPLLTASDVEELLRIPEKSVLNLAREGRIPSLKIGTRRLFNRPAVQAAVTEAAASGRPL